MSKQALNEAISQALSNLDKEKAPDRDLWPGIEQAISRDHTPHIKHRSGLVAVAASIFVVSVVGWMGFVGGQQLQGKALVAAISQQHQDQKQTLLIRFKDQPSATQNWQQQLQELDEAADAVKKALEQEPNNPALLKMLSHVYEQQMTLIERVHAPAWSQI